MKKMISIIISVIILLLFTLMILFKKDYFSENENRYLEEFPKFSINNLFSGKYTTKIDSYITDHFPFRNYFLGLKTFSLKIIKTPKISDVYIGTDDYLLEEFNKPKNNESIARIINKFIDNNNDKNIEIMFVPTSTYIYSDKLPKTTLNYNQHKVIEYYKKNINTSFIDVTDTLLANKDSYIYYRTDHHWTMKGSYLAYKEYCEYNHITPLNYQVKTVNNDFYGTYYSKILDNTLDKDIIYKINIPTNLKITYDNKKNNKIFFDNWLNKKDKYSYYLDGNHKIITIYNSNSSSQEKLLIIKDSYANNFIPFLINHYNEITIIDPRYYKDSINKYINSNDYNNILFLYNISTLDDDLGIRTINRK